MVIDLVNGEKEALLVKDIVKTEKKNHKILLKYKVKDLKAKKIRKNMQNLLQEVQDLSHIQVHIDLNLKSIILKKIKRNKGNQKFNIPHKKIRSKIKKRIKKKIKNKP